MQENERILSPEHTEPGVNVGSLSTPVVYTY